MATHFFISLKKKPFELKSALKVALLGLRLRHGGVSQCDTANRFRVA